MNELRLGLLVRDVVSGFEGTITSRVEYINGCVQYGVVPKSKDGAVLPAAEYIDWQRLHPVLRKGKPVALSFVSQPTGGPQRDAPRR